jgi:hypothetical protein
MTPGAAHHLAEAKAHTHWFWVHSPQPIEHPQALAALLATIVSTDKREAGISAEFFTQPAAQAVVDGQCLGLTAVMGEREHQQPDDRLAERMGPGQGDDPLHHLGWAAEPQRHLGPLLARQKVTLS